MSIKDTRFTGMIIDSLIKCAPPKTFKEHVFRLSLRIGNELSFHDDYYTLSLIDCVSEIYL